MNVSQVAFETYQKRKSDPLFMRIMRDLVKRLGKISKPSKRARVVHQEVDAALNKLFENPVVAQEVKCKKGCSACCHTQVTVTSDEAKLLAEKIADGHPINSQRLYIQKFVGNSADNWYKLPYETRGCIFLDGQGSCSIYEDRPSVCRTNHVLSDPSFCDTRDGVEHPIRLLLTEEADMMLMASYTVSLDVGILPVMVGKELQNLLGTREAKNKNSQPADQMVD